MLATLFDVKTVLQSRRRQRTADVFSLVKAIARDESVDADELLRATEDAGLSDEDVFELVELVRERTRLRAVAAKRAAADQELRAINASIESADSVLEVARQKHAKTVEPLLFQRADASSRLSEAESAAAALLNPKNLPKPIAERLEAARSAIHPAAEHLSGLEREIREQTQRSEEATEELRRNGRDPVEMEAAWRDETRRRTVSNADTNLVLHMIRGRIRAEEARERLPAARAALDGAQTALAAVEKEARDF